jgi:anthranilate 1,2-dioxygenase small subunit
MHNGDSQLFATGRYLDKIAVGETPFRFVERLVILDSRKVDTLLVLPL